MSQGLMIYKNSQQKNNRAMIEKECGNVSEMYKCLTMQEVTGRKYIIH